MRRTAPSPTAVASAAAPVVSIATTSPIAAPIWIGLEMPIICRLHVRNVQETIAANTKVDERRLDARLDVDDASFVDIADVTLVARALDVEFFQNTVLQDC